MSKAISLWPVCPWVKESPGNPAGQGWPKWSSCQPQSYKSSGQRVESCSSQTLHPLGMAPWVPVSGRMEQDSHKIHTLSCEAYSSCNITWQAPLAAGSTATVVHVTFCAPLCHGSCEQYCPHFHFTQWLIQGYFPNRVVDSETS